MKTIFLIDDDSDDREIFQEALETFDKKYNYEEAENGEDALKKMEDGLIKMPDIIFLDLNMPRIDGRQFLKIIKQIDRFKNIPIYIYSTSSNDVEKKMAQDNGAAGFMTKHYTMAQLCKELKEVLEIYLK